MHANYLITGLDAKVFDTTKNSPRRETIMNIQEQEERDFYPATAGEVDRFDTFLGAANRGDTEHQWLLSDRDVWYRNPFYSGPDQPHPETDYTRDVPEQIPCPICKLIPIWDYEAECFDCWVGLEKISHDSQYPCDLETLV